MQLRGKAPRDLVVIVQARPICLRLFTHWMRRAASRRLHGRQQQRDQHGDDGDDDQELDQRERAIDAKDDACKPPRT